MDKNNSQSFVPGTRSKSFNLPLSATSTNIHSLAPQTANNSPRPQINLNVTNLSDYLSSKGARLQDANKNTSSLLYNAFGGQNVLNAGLKAPLHELSGMASIESSISTKRRGDKCSRGLRHFSLKVCEKVKQKGITSYNCVADELVNEFCSYQQKQGSQTSAFPGSIKPSTQSSSIDYWMYDQKNVRRRVYDALNVLMAMNIISKHKKEIRWIGLPCNKKQECQDLQEEKKKREERIKEKSEIVKSLIIEQIALKSLAERNAASKEVYSAAKSADLIKLPFVVLSTDAKTSIDCNISGDRKEYAIQFDNNFQFSSHLDVLRVLGFTHGIGNDDNNDETDVNKVCSYLPKYFEPYAKRKF